MASIFSKIAAGEIPSYKCAESDKFYAFLDISPIGKGHTLVIPRNEVDYIFEMEDEDLTSTSSLCTARLMSTSARFTSSFQRKSLRRFQIRFMLSSRNSNHKPYYIYKIRWGVK